jgi:anti-anti-sigma factor
VSGPLLRTAPGAPLRLGLTVGRHDNLLSVVGDLDLATAPRLGAVLTRLQLARRPLVVDLDSVGFADSHGLAPLVDAGERWRDGIPVRLVRVPPQVEAVLTMLEAVHLFVCHRAVTR